MQIDTLIVGEFQVSCYVAWGRGSRDAIVIDPGSDAETIAAALRKHRLSVAVYLLTHGHVDHISGLAALHAAYPAPVAMHPADLAWAFRPQNQLPPFYPAPARPDAEERPAADGQSCTDAGLSYTILATPGHSPGSVCYYFESEGVLFSGDTLFAGSVGRTDLPGGSSQVLTRSLKRLRDLPDATRVFPGHGPATTLAGEKQSNPFLQSGAWYA